MSVALPERLKKTLDDKVFVTVATLQPDGDVRLSPVWVTHDGDAVIFSTTVGTKKEVNLRRDRRVTLVVQPFDAPYTYAEIRGTATTTTTGAQDLIDALTLKYTGLATYTELNGGVPEDAVRVMVRVVPHAIVDYLG